MKKFFDFGGCLIGIIKKNQTFFGGFYRFRYNNVGIANFHYARLPVYGVSANVFCFYLDC